MANPARPQRIGNLRHRIVPYLLEQVPDGGGGYSNVWTAQDAIWCRVEPLRGEARFASRQVLEAVIVRVHVRAAALSADVTRFKHDGAEYEVLARYNGDERSRYITLEAQTPDSEVLP